MKFEEILPLLREGKKATCGNDGSFYMACRKSIFGTDLGISIYRFFPDPKTTDIFHWGVDGNHLLSDEWEIHESDEKPERQQIDSALEKAIKDTVFGFFMSVTAAFTPANALLPPLSEPLTDRIMDTLKQFFEESNK